uniref:L1 transposable element RRM domain-containing protein n=1 Tax=Latimeria chalumnae TaxID=7897 RepID=H2ZTB5_LATCH
MSSLNNKASDLAPLRSELTGPSENISEDIKTILTSIRQISATIVEIKQGNTDILGRLASIETHLSDSDSRLDDQENRARRNNVRILGIPEGVEQGNPTRFLGETLPALLKLPEGTELSIEQAHRSLAPRSVPGQRPRPFIIKLLCFPVKELLLKSARELRTLDWEGHRILFFPDLSKAFQDRRRLFLSVKKILCEKKVKYGLFYPVTLRITYRGETTLFGTVEEAEK